MIQGNTVKTEIKKKYADLTIRKLLLVFIKVMKLEANKRELLSWRKQE